MKKGWTPTGEQKELFKRVALVVVAVLALFAFGVQFGFLSAGGDMTSGKQIVVDCEQTLAVGQSKNFGDCLGQFNPDIRAGEMYITNLGLYSGMQFTIDGIECYNEGEKQYILVRTNKGNLRNYVDSTPGVRNVMVDNLAMTQFGSGSNTVYIRFDGCGGTITPKTCVSSVYTNCETATRTNIKVWLPYGALREARCAASWTEMEECWDGSEIVAYRCVDYQKVSTGNDCPEEPETPPETGGTGGTGGTGSTPCPAIGSMAHATWNSGTCGWECNTGYTMSGGMCVVPTVSPVCGNDICESGETTANCVGDCPAPVTTEEEFDIVEYASDNLPLVVGGVVASAVLLYMIYEAVKPKTKGRKKR